ncbi:MAG: hypothetical protein AAGA03_15800, partial [Planctomycetota bacterium]
IRSVAPVAAGVSETAFDGASDLATKGSVVGRDLIWRLGVGAGRLLATLSGWFFLSAAADGLPVGVAGADLTKSRLDLPSFPGVFDLATKSLDLDGADLFAPPSLDFATMLFRDTLGTRSGAESMAIFGVALLLRLRSDSEPLAEIDVRRLLDCVDRAVFLGVRFSRAKLGGVDETGLRVAGEGLLVAGRCAAPAVESAGGLGRLRFVSLGGREAVRELLAGREVVAVCGDVVRFLAALRPGSEIGTERSDEPERFAAWNGIPVQSAGSRSLAGNGVAAVLGLSDEDDPPNRPPSRPPVGREADGFAAGARLDPADASLLPDPRTTA